MEQDDISISTNALIVIDSPVSLEQQVLIIQDVYQQIKSKDKTLMAIRTRVWCKLGKMLIEHRKNVLKAGYTWDFWVLDHFPYIKERRRQQCMKIAECNEKTLEYFYHLGFDRLYELIGTLQPYMKDIDYKYIVTDKYGYIFRNIQQDAEDKEDFNTKIDIIIKYFTFKKNIASKVFNRELVIDTLEAGVNFKKPDYDYLNSAISEDDFNLYLTKMILTAGSPSKSSSQSTSSRVSIYVMIAQMLESLREYNSTNNYPQHLNMFSVNLIDETIKRLVDYRNITFTSNNPLTLI